MAQIDDLGLKALKWATELYCFHVRDLHAFYGYFKVAVNS